MCSHLSKSCPFFPPPITSLHVSFWAPPPPSSSSYDSRLHSFQACLCIYFSTSLSLSLSLIVFISSSIIESLMAYYTTKSLALHFTTLMAFSCTLIRGGNVYPASTISAAPALLPDPISPSSSPPPSMSPDIYPVFPSAGAPQLAPSDSSAPLIPSSPSPPNPDEYASEGPGAAFPPTGMLPLSSSEGRCVEVLLSSAAVVLAGFWIN